MYDKLWVALSSILCLCRLYLNLRCIAAHYCCCMSSAQHITITVLCYLHMLLAAVSADLVAFYSCEAIASFDHCHLPAHHHHIFNFSRLGQLCHALPVR